MSLRMAPSYLELPQQNEAVCRAASVPLHIIFYTMQPIKMKRSVKTRWMCIHTRNQHLQKNWLATNKKLTELWSDSIMFPCSSTLFKTVVTLDAASSACLRNSISNLSWNSTSRRPNHMLRQNQLFFISSFKWPKRQKYTRPLIKQPEQIKVYTDNTTENQDDLELPLTPHLLYHSDQRDCVQDFGAVHSAQPALLYPWRSTAEFRINIQNLTRITVIW